MPLGVSNHTRQPSFALGLWCKKPPSTGPCYTPSECKCWVHPGLPVSCDPPQSWSWKWPPGNSASEASLLRKKAAPGPSGIHICRRESSSLPPSFARWHSAGEGHPLLGLPGESLGIKQVHSQGSFYPLEVASPPSRVMEFAGKLPPSCAHCDAADRGTGPEVGTPGHALGGPLGAGCSGRQSAPCAQSHTRAATARELLISAAPLPVQGCHTELWPSLVPQTPKIQITVPHVSMS